MSNTTPAWTIASNIFLTAIKGSYINAQKMSNFFMSKLNANAADPDILLIKTDMLPFDTAMNTTYTAFIAQGGIQNGASETFATKLAEITANVGQWDSAAKLIYPPATAGGPYMTLFPNGHAPYQTGAQINRLNAVSALMLALTTAATADPANATALLALKATVNSYYVDLKKAFDEKNDGKNISSIQSDACFDASVAVAEQMYIGLAKLMIKFYKTPEVIGGYFDEATIRKHTQTDFSHIVKHGQTYTIAQRTLAATNQIRINNTGSVLLRFYLANVKDAAIGTAFVEVAPGANTTYTAAQLGDFANNHFIMVVNPDTLQSGSFALNLL